MSKESELVNKLTNLGYTLSVAESCTGGLLSAAIVSVSGASAVYGVGFTTYANSAKERYVGVDADALAGYGAVSEIVASQMAKGCAKAADAELGISTTGIAGPDGGTDEKPVGLVYIGCSYLGHTIVEKHLFRGDRDNVRKEAVNAALDLALRSVNSS